MASPKRDWPGLQRNKRDITCLARFTSASASAREGDSVVTATVQLSEPFTTPVRVDYVVSGSTASSGVDYSLDAGTLTFAPGIGDQTLALALVDDGEAEADETVVVRLTNPDNGELATPSRFILTILDNDDSAPPCGFRPPANHQHLHDLGIEPQTSPSGKGTALGSTTVCAETSGTKRHLHGGWQSVLCFTAALSLVAIKYPIVPVCQYWFYPLCHRRLLPTTTTDCPKREWPVSATIRARLGGPCGNQRRVPAEPA